MHLYLKLSVVCARMLFWFGVVWCGLVWFGVVWCGVVWLVLTIDRLIYEEQLVCFDSPTNRRFIDSVGRGA